MGIFGLRRGDVDVDVAGGTDLGGIVACGLMDGGRYADRLSSMTRRLSASHGDIDGAFTGTRFSGAVVVFGADTQGNEIAGFAGADVEHGGVCAFSAQGDDTLGVHHLALELVAAGADDEVAGRAVALVVDDELET